MKKIVMLITVLVLVAGVVFAQADLPTKAEAAAVIEGYFRCLGNGDMENLPKYITKEAVEKKAIDVYTAISAALNETQKKECIAYKANIIEMRPMYGVFVRCFLAENLLPIMGYQIDLIKENGAWKLKT
jgi:hypothetical protein